MKKRSWWHRFRETLQTAWRDISREWDQRQAGEGSRRPAPKAKSKAKSPLLEQEAREKDILGRNGEDEAVRFLKSQGYRILERNLKFKMGELDIIAMKDDCVAFIEVKTRSTDESGLPFEAVTPPKMRRIVTMAELYIRRKKLADRELSFRFDIISIVWPKGELPQIEHYENAFDANAKYPRVVKK